MHKLDWERQRNQISNCRHTLDHRKQTNSRKTSISASWPRFKAFDCVDYNKLWQILKEIGIPVYLTCLLRNLYVHQEATVRTDMKQSTGSKVGKEYIKAVYCHTAYLTYIQSSSCEMPGWMNPQAGIKFTGRNINNLRNADDTSLMAESEEELKSPLKVKEESEKAGLKLNKIMTSSPITSWQINGDTI